MKEEVTSFQDIVAIFQRRKWSLILTPVLVFAIALAAALMIPRTYRSTSTILIEEQELPREFVLSTVTGFAEQRLEKINQRVMISTKLMDIINRFNLYSEKRNSLSDEEIIALMRKNTLFKTISAEVDTRTGSPSAVIAFSISYEGNRPEQVQQVAANLASLYLEVNLRTREQQSSGAFNFLDEESKNLKEQINKIDVDISGFKQKNADSLPELLSVNLQALDGIGRDIDRMNDMMRTLKERKSYFESQLDMMPKDSDNQDRTLLRELKAKLVQLESRYSNKYPEVIKTRIEIARLEARLKKTGGENTGKPDNSGTEKYDNPLYVMLASQLAGVKSEIDSVKRQTDDMNRKKDEYRHRIEKTPKVDEIYKRLLSERNNTQLKYDDLIKKAMDAKISLGLEKEQMGQRFNLIDPARLPEKPIKPNIPVILSLGLLLGICAGLGFASIREATDSSVKSARLLATETALPVLASIPDIVTWGDRRRERTQRIALAVGLVVVVVAGIAAFHFYVMDLDILWVKVLKRVNA